MIARLAQLRPETVFAGFASLFGLLFCLLIPPLGGGNETFNFSRAAGIAYGHVLIGDIQIPGGLVRLIRQGGGFFPEGATLPLGYRLANVAALARIPLDAAHPALLAANPIAIHNPLPYLPQAAVLRAGAALGLRPLTLFYAARATGLLCAICLTYLAIRRAPGHRHVLAALALLPPLAFGRSTLDADQINNALAFLFTATVWRATLRPGRAQAAELLPLAAMAFVVAQSKTAYFPLPLLVLAIPAARFGGAARRLAWLAALTLPGLLSDAAYVVALQQTTFAGLTYQTWAGAADPTRQLALVLHDPLFFAGVMARTLFLTPLVPLAALQMLGTFGPPISLPVPLAGCLAALLAAVALTDGTSRQPRYPPATALLGALIAVAVLLITLTLLYVQWTGYAAATILGFQGRYLYPVLPALLPKLRATRQAAPLPWLLALAAAGLASAAAYAAHAYYA